MYLPPGFAESDVITAVQSVARRLRGHIKPFSCYTRDDIEAEATLFCLQALSRFKPESGSLEGFLFCHARNRLVNLVRDTVKRPDKDAPCPGCLRADQEGRKSEHDGGELCVSYRRWRDRMQKKADLSYSLPVSAAMEERPSPEPSAEDLHDGEELEARIDRELDPDLRADYLRLVQAGGQKGSGVPSHRLQKVRQAVADILGTYI